MRERNQVSVALWGTLLVALVLLASMNLDRLPFLNSTHTYHAYFENADGITDGDDVRVEGISVGQVDSVTVQGAHVDIAFDVQSGLTLGGQTRASIEVATVLGNMFLQLESAGPGTLADGAAIPQGRTTPAYSLLGALNAFGEFSDKTHLPTLQSSLHELATTISGISPKDVKSALRGLSTLSSTLAAKQDDISSVLRSANTIVDTLNKHSGDLVALLADGDSYLKMIESRQSIIAALLKDTADLGTQLSVLIGRDGTQLHSLLANLNTVTAVLTKENTQLQTAITSLGQFSENIANATGSGPWLDLLTPTAVVPDNQIAQCGKNPAAGPKPCSP